MKKIVLLADKEPVVGDQWMVRAHIAVGWHTQDRVLLSPDCVSPLEVDAWANDIIRQVQEVKRQARRIKWDNHPRSR